MLRKLGRRLTLVNVLVSGAILIAMAAIALGVTERMIARRSEEELAVFARWSLAAMHEAINAEEDVRIRVPEQFWIYLEDDAGRARLVTESGMDEETATAIAQKVREKVGGRLDAFWRVEEGGEAKEITLDRSLVASPPETPPEASASDGRAGKPVIRSFARPVDRQAVRVASTVSEFQTAEARGKHFRVSATVISSDAAQNLVLVMQDRSDELTSRYRLRWIFAGCVAGGLILIVLASRYLSGRAIRPIDESIRRQRAFVAAASHELRTPVAALRANAEVLRDAPLGEYAPYLDSIQSVSERMSLLISDLTDLARSDAEELAVREEPVEAHDVALGALRLMRPLADRRRIRVAETLEPVVLVGDPDRLRQVLLALLDNALRYTQDGGEISVQTRLEGRTAVVRVADTGIGIADEHKPHVFDRFYRVDAARSRESGGAGLGLSVVRQLVDKMNGTIALLDNPGGGTVMEMRFRAAVRP